jgi:DNA mismatch repair ATPase MutL
LPSTNGSRNLDNLPIQPNTTRPSPPVAPNTRTLPTFTEKTPSITMLRNNQPINNDTSTSSKMNTTPTQNTSSKSNSSSKMNTTPTKNNSMKNNTSNFKDVSNSSRKNYKQDDEQDDEQDLENPARKEDEESELSDDEDSEDNMEGFQGSQQIEGNALKKMLLALLITFLGYMLILSAMNNLIPITTYAPHLKQFKHFIYGGLFFIIVYLCLEVF